jgi:hypothetical protein
MIDDYAKAMELVRKMEADLPIPPRTPDGQLHSRHEDAWGQNRS